MRQDFLATRMKGKGQAFVDHRIVGNTRTSGSFKLGASGQIYVSPQLDVPRFFS